jgi:hypothetical protein
MKKTLLLTVAGILAGTMCLFAQPGGFPGGGGGFPGGGFPGGGEFPGGRPGGAEFKMPELPPELSPEERTAEMVEKFGLSPEQEATLLELNKRYEGKLEYRPQQQNMQDIREMSDEERQELFNKMAEQMAEMEKILEEIEANKKAYEGALKALFDKKQFRAYQKEQRQKATEQRRRMESMFMGGGFDGPGGGFGGPGGGFGGGGFGGPGGF